VQRVLHLVRVRVRVRVRARARARARTRVRVRVRGRVRVRVSSTSRPRRSVLDQRCSASGLSAAGAGSFVCSASSVCMKRARFSSAAST